MFACEYIFFPQKGSSPDDFLAALWAYIGSLHQGGQTVNNDNLILKGSRIRYPCVCPEADSLDQRHRTSYAKESHRRVMKLSDREPQIKVLGEIVETPSACHCQKSSFYILFTHFLDGSSPIVCGRCRCPVPLYRFRHKGNGAQAGFLSWQEMYRNCDSLFMASGAGEKFGYRQISDFDSELTKLGRKLCAKLEKQTRVKTYYYLHRYYGTSPASESKRWCPGCGRNWIKYDSAVFQLRCDTCRLFSTGAMSFKKI